MGNRVTDSERHGRWWRALHWFDIIMSRLVPTIAIAVAAVALIATFFIWQGLEDKADRAELKADRVRIQIQQQETGRRIARETLCGGVLGVQRAGRRALTGTLLPAPFQPQGTRAERRIRRASARVYSRIISEAVIEQAGVEAEGLLKPNGMLDCEQLSTIAQPKAP